MENRVAPEFADEPVVEIKKTPVVDALSEKTVAAVNPWVSEINVVLATITDENEKAEAIRAQLIKDEKLTEEEAQQREPGIAFETAQYLLMRAIRGGLNELYETAYSQSAPTIDDKTTDDIDPTRMLANAIQSAMNNLFFIAGDKDREKAQKADATMINTVARDLIGKTINLHFDGNGKPTAHSMLPNNTTQDKARARARIELARIAHIDSVLETTLAVARRCRSVAQTGWKAACEEYNQVLEGTRKQKTALYKRSRYQSRRYRARSAVTRNLLRKPVGKLMARAKGWTTIALAYSGHYVVAPFQKLLIDVRPAFDAEAKLVKNNDKQGWYARNIADPMAYFKRENAVSTMYKFIKAKTENNAILLPHLVTRLNNATLEILSAASQDIPVKGKKAIARMVDRQLAKITRATRKAEAKALKPALKTTTAEWAKKFDKQNQRVVSQLAANRYSAASVLPEISPIMARWGKAQPITGFINIKLT